MYINIPKGQTADSGTPVGGPQRQDTAQPLDALRVGECKHDKIGWWSAVDARGMAVGRARLGTPKWRRRPVSSMIIRGSYPRLSSSDTPSRLLLGLKRHAYFLTFS